MNQGKTPIYQIKVTLRHVAPPVWRRIEVPADNKLDKLHHVLQAVMGWTDSHLHAFRQGMVQYGTASRAFPDMFKNERSARLDPLVGKGGKLIYEYDFGDGWEHELKIEKALAPEPGLRYPRCTAGKRACPPGALRRSLGIRAPARSAARSEARRTRGEARMDRRGF